MSEFSPEARTAAPVAPLRLFAQLRDSARKLLLWVAARILVTPFSGFVLCTHFTASEIHKYDLRYLNRQAVDLDQTKHVSGPSVIYCQIDHLDHFIAEILPGIEDSFVLITGRANLPGFAWESGFETLLHNDYLQAWYIQNLTEPGVMLRHFPYGVNIDNALLVLLTIPLSFVKTRRRVLVPFARAHSHMPEDAKAARQGLESCMERPLRRDRYLRAIARSRYVVSPAGDRPDTFRHWECIALGATPISNIPENFASLFGESLVVEPVLSCEIRKRVFQSKRIPNRRLAALSTWRDKVRTSLTGNSG